MGGKQSKLDNVSVHSVQSDSDFLMYYWGPIASDFQKQKLFLQDLPAEIHLELFDILPPISSAALGLTCRKFYSLHKSKHGRVDLQEEGEMLRQGTIKMHRWDIKLHHLLRGWMWQSARLVWGGGYGYDKFITLQQRSKSEKEIAKAEKKHAKARKAKKAAEDAFISWSKRLCAKRPCDISTSDAKTFRSLVRKAELAASKSRRPSYRDWKEQAEDDEVAMGFLGLKDPGALPCKPKARLSRFAVFRTKA